MPWCSWTTRSPGGQVGEGAGASGGCWPSALSGCVRPSFPAHQRGTAPRSEWRCAAPGTPCRRTGRPRSAVIWPGWGSSCQRGNPAADTTPVLPEQILQELRPAAAVASRARWRQGRCSDSGSGRRLRPPDWRRRRAAAWQRDSSASPGAGAGYCRSQEAVQIDNGGTARPRCLAQRLIVWRSTAPASPPEQTGLQQGR